MNKKRYWFYTYKYKNYDKIENGVTSIHPILHFKERGSHLDFILLSFVDITNELENNPEFLEYIEECVEHFGTLL